MQCAPFPHTGSGDIAHRPLCANKYQNLCAEVSEGENFTWIYVIYVIDENKPLILYEMKYVIINKGHVQ